MDTATGPGGNGSYGGALDSIDAVVEPPTVPPSVTMSTRTRSRSIDIQIYSPSQSRDTLPGYSPPRVNPPTYSEDQLARGIVGWLRDWWRGLSGDVNVPHQNLHVVYRDAEFYEMVNFRLHRFDLIWRNGPGILKYFIPPIIFLAIVGLTLVVWKFFKGGPHSKN